MSFSARSLSNLKEQIDIVDVVSRAITLKRAGSNYKGVCPFHKEKTPSFIVSEQKQIFTCFGCNATGDAIEFTKRFYNLDFNEAVEKLAKEYGVELEKTHGSDQNLDIYYQINKEAAGFFYRAFTEKANKGYSYMKNRGISPSILKKFGIGYADEEWQSLYEYLTSKGYEKEKLLELGLCAESKGRVYDKFRNRVMFPIINTSGKVIGFGGRAIDPNDSPKYLNSPESKVFRKKNNLYGLNLTRQQASKEGFIILVEGYMDTIGLFQAGVENVAASLGTALTEGQARLIKRYTKDVVLSYDADTAGRAAAMRGADILRQEDCKVRVMHVTDGKDPDEYIKHNGKKAFLDLVEKAPGYADYKIQAAKEGINIKTEEGKIEALRRIAFVLKNLSPVEQDIYVQKVAKDMGVSENAIRRELSENRRDNQKSDREKERSRERERTEEAPKERLTGTEKEILRLLMRNEGYIPRVAEEKDLLVTGTGQRIYEAIKKALEENNLDSNRVVDLLPETDKDEFIDIMENISSSGDEEKVWNDCLRRTKLSNLIKEEKKLMTMLELSEESEIAGAENEILRKLQNIQEEIQRERAKDL